MKDIKPIVEMKNWKKALILGLLVVFTVGVTYLNPSKGALSWAPIKKVILPQAYAYEDYQEINKVYDENPVQDEFFSSLKKFSYDTAVEVFQSNQENISYSPLSFYFALAMATSGAEGETLEELLSFMGMVDKASLLENSGNLFRRLYFDNEIGQLKIANSLWMNKEVVWKEPFIKNSAENFYATSYQMDFNDKKTELAMSAWVYENTGKILKPEIELSPNDILSILSTVYFYDQWMDEFDGGKTKEDVFHLQDKSEVKTDFMNSHYGAHGFIKGEGFTRSSLNMKNSTSMVFILPDKGVSPQDLLSTPEKMKKAFESGEEGYGEVLWQVPKFSFESKIDLRETLELLGVTAAFEADANFRSITDQIAYIGGIQQESHISIDEKGVEAAAFTQINFVGSGLPTDKAEMILNRPFIYGIQASDGTLLFVGICENPIVK